MPEASSPAELLRPDVVAKLGRVDLVARTVVEGFIAGLHRSVHHGLSVDFDHHREYSPGDDTRRLDWRVWARSDRFYLKQFEEETNTRVTLLLDTSASMGYGSAGITKLPYACYLAAVLGDLGICPNEPTGLGVFDGEARPCF